jgi:hypothetical protein
MFPVTFISLLATNNQQTFTVFIDYMFCSEQLHNMFFVDCFIFVYFMLSAILLDGITSLAISVFHLHCFTTLLFFFYR